MTPATDMGTAAGTRRPAQILFGVMGGSLRVAWTTLCVAVIGGALAIGVAWHTYGYVPVAVRSGSMEPTLPVHSLLFVEEVPAASVRVGDVITFDPPGPVPRTTHRVTDREMHNGTWYFRTKGDANTVEDDWRQAESGGAATDALWLRGVAYPDGTAVRYRWHVPEIGRVAALSAMENLRAALLAIPFVLVGLQLLVWIWSSAEDDDQADHALSGEDLDAYFDDIWDDEGVAA